MFSSFTARNKSSDRKHSHFSFTQPSSSPSAVVPDLNRYSKSLADDGCTAYLTAAEPTAPQPPQQAQPAASTAGHSFHNSSSPLPSPPLPRRHGRPPAGHARSLTFDGWTSHPPSPLITNFSKPTVYPQEPSLPVEVYDPITDLDLDIDVEPSPPASPVSASPFTLSKDRWSFLSGFKSDSGYGGSPTKSSFSFGGGNGSGGEGESGRKSPTKSESSSNNRSSRIIADWFQGESAPLNIGVVKAGSGSNSSTRASSPAKELLQNPLDSIPNLVPDMLSRRSTTSPTSLSGSGFQQQQQQPPNQQSNHSPSNSTSSAITSLISKTFSRALPPSPPNPSNSSDDPLLNLHIPTALAPESTQPFSPAAFKNLHQKAEGLLSRLHAAYRSRTQEAVDARAEAAVLTDELDGSRARAECLREQLDGLAEKNIQLTESVAGLVEELAREKAARRQDARERSLRLVGDSNSRRSQRNGSGSSRRRVRASNASTVSSMVSDSGFESNTEAEAETEDEETEVPVRVVSSPGSASPSSIAEGEEWRYPEAVQLSSPSKAMPGIKVSPTSPISPTSMPMASPGIAAMDTRGNNRGGNHQYQLCVNCRGRVSGAWALVGDLRSENENVNASNRVLERGIDDCLEMVDDLLSGVRR